MKTKRTITMRQSNWFFVVIESLFFSKGWYLCFNDINFEWVIKIQRILGINFSWVNVWIWFLRLTFQVHFYCWVKIFRLTFHQKRNQNQNQNEDDNSCQPFLYFYCSLAKSRIDLFCVCINHSQNIFPAILLKCLFKSHFQIEFDKNSDWPWWFSLGWLTHNFIFFRFDHWDGVKIKFRYLEVGPLIFYFSVFFEFLMTEFEGLLLDDIVDWAEFKLFGEKGKSLLEFFNKVFGGIFVFHGKNWDVIRLGFTNDL